MSEVKLVNVTPHSITIVDDSENVVRVIEPSGMVARVQTEQRVVGYIDDIPFVRTSFGEIEGLPDPVPGTIYIASTLVAQAARRAGRTDVVSPDTGPTAVRNEANQVVAVRRLQIPE